MESTEICLQQIEHLKLMLDQAEAVVVGAGAGLSTSAGFTYSGKRFTENFADFIGKYHFTDMYSAGFYQFDTLEEKWAYWSRHIYLNRYVPPLKPVYDELLQLVENKDYFVLTTNVDHMFQRTGFDRKRLFYTQGDYGLWQCSEPCHQSTYDNEAIVLEMIDRQKDMRIPADLVPRCPVCSRPMTMNLRVDDTFVEDDGWHRAQRRYRDYIQKHRHGKILYLELGVGQNTPGIIKYPFWKMALANPEAAYACLNQGEACVPPELEEQTLCISNDISDTLEKMDLSA